MTRATPRTGAYRHSYEINDVHQPEGWTDLHLSNDQLPGNTNILVLHGARGSAEKMAPFASAFSTSNLLLCDLRAYGQSDAPLSDYTPPAMAKDLVAPVKMVFGDAPFAVIAESFSGIIALEFGRLMPNLKCIVMADTPFDNYRMHESLVGLVQTYEERPDKRKVIACFATDFFGLDVVQRTVSPRPITSPWMEVESPF